MPTKAKKEFAIRAGKKALDAAKGSPIESTVKKNVKKMYKESGIGKPKGYAKTGPSMSAKKMPERVKIAGKIKRKLSPAKMPNQPNFGTKSGFKKGLKEGAKALKDMFKSGKK